MRASCRRQTRLRSEKSTRELFHSKEQRGQNAAGVNIRFDMSIAQSRQSAPGQPELTTVATRDVRQTSTRDVYGVAFAQIPVIANRCGERVKSTRCCRGRSTLRGTRRNAVVH